MGFAPGWSLPLCAEITHVVSSQMHQRPSMTASKYVPSSATHSANAAPMSLCLRSKYGVS